MEKPPFELRILGPTEFIGPVSEACEAIVRQPKRLALLAYLALNTADGFRRRDQVIALFWPELDQSQARTYLRKALYAIRDELGGDVFVSRGEDEIRVDPTRIWCDAVALAQHVREGAWSQALLLYRGELLDGLFPEGVAQEFQEWLSEQRKTSRGLAAQAAWESSHLHQERGDHALAAVAARRARDLDPDNEEGVRRLMELLDRRGDRGGALRVYGEWQARLQKEYGVEPAPETRKLARKVQAARKGESHETPPMLAPIVAHSGELPPPVRTAGAERRESGRGRRAMPVAVGLALVVVFAGGALVLSRTAPTEFVTPPRSIAVLPLRPIGSAELQSAADAVTEELTTALALDTGIVVRSIPRWQDSVRGGGDVDVSGGRLGVAYVVEGGVQGGGGKFRITLRLLRTADAVSVWAGRYDADGGELMTIARRVAAEAATAIHARLATANAARSESHR